MLYRTYRQAGAFIAGFPRGVNRSFPGSYCGFERVRIRCRLGPIYDLIVAHQPGAGARSG
jgi:hypothetical protein